MKVKKLEFNDIENIKQIENQCFSNPWSQTSIKQSMESGNKFFGVFNNDTLCGYGSINIILDEGYINNIAVLPKYRKQGLGKLILSEIINYSKEKKLSFLSLEVRPSNTIAIRLYKSAGFINAGVRKNYYTCPVENALILTKYFNTKE